MELRSDGKKFSFDILGTSRLLEEDDALTNRPISDPSHNYAVQLETTSASTHEKPKCKKRKHKKGSKRKKTIESSIPDDTITLTIPDPDSIFDHYKNTGTLPENGESSCTYYANGFESNCKSYSAGTIVCEENMIPEESGGSLCTVTQVMDPEFPNVRGEGFNFGELRQRSVGGAADDAAASRVEENAIEKGIEVSSAALKQQSEPNGAVLPKRLDTAESLDWKRLMAEDPNFTFSVEKSPVKYFLEEMYNGNSLRSTTTLGNEKERERVYDTIFRLPWRCELLIDVGFFVCFDSFLSLLTVMPTRILITLWRLLCTRLVIFYEVFYFLVKAYAKNIVLQHTICEWCFKGCQSLRNAVEIWSYTNELTSTASCCYVCTCWIVCNLRCQLHKRSIVEKAVQDAVCSRTV